MLPKERYPKFEFSPSERKQVISDMVDILSASYHLSTPLASEEPDTEKEPNTENQPDTENGQDMSASPGRLFPFLCLPRELRQMILFYALTQKLERIDDQIIKEASEACECRFLTCLPIQPICLAMKAQATALRYKRVRQLADWIKHISRGNREIEADFENGYTSWVTGVGGVNEGGKAAKKAKGRKAFMLWVFETAGCATTVELLGGKRDV